MPAAARSQANHLIVSARELGWAITIAVVVAAAAWIAAKFLERAYRADTVLVVAEDNENALGALTGQLGGIASVFGGGMGGRGTVNEVLATLRSRYIVTKFLESPQRLQEITALIWRDNAPPANAEDLRNQAVGYIRQRVIAVSYDQMNGTIRLSITLPDRQQAAQWANEFVALANLVMRDRTVGVTQRRMKVLQDAAALADSVTLRDAIFRVLESQVKSEMLAATKPEFALRVIDPAITPAVANYVRPQRALIALGAALVSFVVAVAFCMGRTAWRESGGRASAPPVIAD